jgi:protein-tyrosine-phosphatase
MPRNPIIIFVCEHGAAKSIIAAAYFNQLAHQKSLHFKAVARGTNPDPELSLQTIQGLSKDGLISAESIPQQLLSDDIQSVERIISFCELPVEYREKAIVEDWNDVPPVSEDYDKARDAILEHIRDLINNIRSTS